MDKLAALEDELASAKIRLAAEIQCRCGEAATSAQKEIDELHKRIAEEVASRLRAA